MVMVSTDEAKEAPVLQFHLEPDEPVEVGELTNALDAVAHQFQVFSDTVGIESGASARLLVSSVSPGSIDINFLPDIVAIGATISSISDSVGFVVKFAEHIKCLIDIFSGEHKGEVPSYVTVKDCDDAINIASPTAQHGGSQTFNIYNAPVIQYASLESKTARKVVENASNHKAQLQFPQSERRQRVSMVWAQLNRDPARVKGASSPDKGIIEEIDPKPKAILFTDELSYLKLEMLAEDENPMKKVYFVDVEVSRVRDKITAYRIVGYHGCDDLNSD